MIAFQNYFLRTSQTCKREGSKVTTGTTELTKKGLQRGNFNSIIFDKLYFRVLCQHSVYSVVKRLFQSSQKKKLDKLVFFYYNIYV